MTINFSLDYQNHNFQIELNPQDTEVLTQREWKTLYQNAQALYLPYYWLSIAIIKDQGTFRGICYDGSTLEKLNKLKKENQVLVDPLTRSPILTIHHIFFNCFELALDNTNNMLLTPLTEPEISCFSSDECEGNPQLMDCVKASLASLDSKALTSSQKNLIGKMQFIVGCTLLNKDENEDKEIQIEGIRWLVSALKQGIPEADVLLARKEIYPVWIQKQSV